MLSSSKSLKCSKAQFVSLLTPYNLVDQLLGRQNEICYELYKIPLQSEQNMPAITGNYYCQVDCSWNVNKTTIGITLDVSSVFSVGVALL